MTLREAVRTVLIEYGGVLTAEEIRLQIASRNLFTKRDGTFPDSSYVLYGIKNYPAEFEVIIRLRG